MVQVWIDIHSEELMLDWELAVEMAMIRFALRPFSELNHDNSTETVEPNCGSTSVQARPRRVPDGRLAWRN